MKTVIVSTSFLDNTDAHGDSYLERARRFVEYYRNPELKRLLGHTHHIFLDNGSETKFDKCNDVQIVRFPKADDGQHTRLQYPHLWRATYFLPEIIKDYDRIIWTDNDVRILSPRLAEYMGSVDYGWVAMYSNAHNFPESSLSVLCKHGGEDVLGRWIQRKPWEERCGQMYENSVPYTSVRRDFIGDRYGDIRPTPPEQNPSMDWYGNSMLQTSLEFNRYAKKD